jgi:hypothetical protein
MHKKKIHIFILIIFIHSIIYLPIYIKNHVNLINLF